MKQTAVLLVLCIILAACESSPASSPSLAPVSEPASSPSLAPVSEPALAPSLAPVTQPSPVPEPAAGPIVREPPVQETPVPDPALPVPVIYAPAFQETVYNGSPQPIYARCEPLIPLIIEYFNSRDDYWKIQNGFFDPPSEPGIYYVGVNCAPGYGYAQTDDILVEFLIKRAPVKITGDKTQSAVFNGNPRRVQVTAEPAVPLSFSYYPNPDLLRSALEIFLQPGEGQSSLASALQGFTRVESAPTEQGTYYVLVYFNGNERYEKAHAEIEFVINPAARRN